MLTNQNLDNYIHVYGYVMLRYIYQARLDDEGFQPSFESLHETWRHSCSFGGVLHFCHDGIHLQDQTQMRMTTQRKSIETI